MNQNKYTIEVPKDRQIYLSEIRSLFTREVITKNALRDTIKLEDVYPVTIKRINNEVPVWVYYKNGGIAVIPVRCDDETFDRILIDAAKDTDTIPSPLIDDRIPIDETNDEKSQGSIVETEKVPSDLIDDGHIYLADVEEPVIEEEPEQTDNDPELEIGIVSGVTIQKGTGDSWVSNDNTEKDNTEPKLQQAYARPTPRNANNNRHGKK